MLPRLTDRVRLALLAVVAGACDATAFERLGHVFASVITGNLVVLGVSATRGDGTDAVSAVCAVGGYALGVLVAAPRDTDAARTSLVRGRLTGEAGVLIAFAIAWELAGTHPGRGIRLAMLIVLAAAMGVQSVAVRRLGSASTTYLTGTFTGLLEALRAGRWSEEQRRAVAVLAAALLSAALATVLLEHARRALPALVLLPLAIAVAAPSDSRSSTAPAPDGG